MFEIHDHGSHIPIFDHRDPLAFSLLNPAIVV